MAFLRSRTGVSLRADLRSVTSDFSLSLREEDPLRPMTSFTPRVRCDRVKRSTGLSANGLNGHWPLSRGFSRVITAAGTGSATGAAGAGADTTGAGAAAVDAGMVGAGAVGTATGGIKRESWLSTLTGVAGIVPLR